MPGWRGLGAAVLLSALVAGLYFRTERTPPGLDLQLFAPHWAPPGSPVAMRAFVVPHDPAASAGELPAFVDIKLLSPHGELVVETSIRQAAPIATSPAGEMGVAPTAVDPNEARRYGLQGVLELPPGLAPGRYRLEAKAQLEPRPETSVTVTQGLDVTGDAPALAWRRLPPSTPGPIDRLALVETPTEPGPDGATMRLEPRVLGGACAEDLPCDLAVWVGEPAARLRIHSAYGFVPVTPEDELPQSGIVVFRGTVRDPEASVTMIAARDGVDIARRVAPLPLVRRAPALAPGTPRMLLGTSHGISIRLGREPSPLLIDLFDDGRWVAALSRWPRPSLPHGEALALPLRADGLHRVQVRTDPSDAATVVSRVVVSAATEEAALAIVRARLLANGAEDAFTLGMPHAGIAAERQIAFALASTERDHLLLPAPTRRGAEAEN